MTEYQINILHTEQGVNMGDHGQDVTRAVPVDDSMTSASWSGRASCSASGTRHSSRSVTPT